MNEIQNLQSGLKFTSWGLKYPDVQKFLEQYKPSSVIDFGCSSGGMIAQIKQDYDFVTHAVGYDPGNPDFDVMPSGQYECLVSCDVVEHIEPADLDSTLKIMQSKFSRSAYIIAACYPAKKHLADGRNAHLTIENREWWLNKIQTQFDQCCITWHEAVDYPSKRGPMPELRLILEKQ